VAGLGVAVGVAVDVAVGPPQAAISNARSAVTTKWPSWASAPRRDMAYSLNPACVSGRLICCKPFTPYTLQGAKITSEILAIPAKRDS